MLCGGCEDVRGCSWALPVLVSACSNPPWSRSDGPPEIKYENTLSILQSPQRLVAISVTQQNKNQRPRLAKFPSPKKVSDWLSSWEGGACFGTCDW